MKPILSAALANVPGGPITTIAGLVIIGAGIHHGITSGQWETAVTVITVGSVLLGCPDKLNRPQP